MLKPGTKPTRPPALQLEGPVQLAWGVSSQAGDQVEATVKKELHRYVAALVDDMMAGERVPEDEINQHIQALLSPKLVKDFLTQNIPMPWVGRAAVRIGDRFPLGNVLFLLRVRDGILQDIESPIGIKPAVRVPGRKEVADGR